MIRYLVEWLGLVALFYGSFLAAVHLVIPAMDVLADLLYGNYR